MIPSATFTQFSLEKYCCMHLWRCLVLHYPDIGEKKSPGKIESQKLTYPVYGNVSKRKTLRGQSSSSYILLPNLCLKPLAPLESESIQKKQVVFPEISSS